jgi:hypothetical protein
MVLDGTVTVHKIWGGRAQLEEIEADGPNGHWEGLTLFLYNPKTHQWSQTFIDSKDGVLNSPTIGDFHNGNGELFSNDTYEGNAVMLKGVWSDIAADSHRYTELFSNDGGRTWAPVFLAELTRERGSANWDDAAETEVKAGEEHAFDFDFGKWKAHSSRLMQPLTGSATWLDMDGVSVIHRVWGGRANLAEYKADGPAGHIELLALRWFNLTTQEWNLDFATPNVGTLGIPGVGKFQKGRAEFYDFEPIDGRQVLVRFTIGGTGHETVQSEQAFSVDGGKTWEVNWKNSYTR